MSRIGRQRARKARRPSAGKGRSRKIKQERIIRRRALKAALVFVLAVMLFAAVYRITRERYSEKVDYPESSHAWWESAWNEENGAKGTDDSRLPRGEAEVGVGPGSVEKGK